METLVEADINQTCMTSFALRCGGGSRRTNPPGQLLLSLSLFLSLILSLLYFFSFPPPVSRSFDLAFNDEQHFSSNIHPFI